MFWVVFLLALQVTLAAMVFFILKARLGRELLTVALERLQGAAVPDTAAVRIVSAEPLGEGLQGHIRSIIGRRAAGATVNFSEDPALKGGLVIEWPGSVLDYSVANRLKNFWV